jgi:hypothetical protein
MTMPEVNSSNSSTTKGIQTDFDGGYSIKMRGTEDCLFSIVGSKSYTLTIGSTKQSQCTIRRRCNGVRKCYR